MIVFYTGRPVKLILAVLILALAVGTVEHLLFGAVLAVVSPGQGRLVPIYRVKTDEKVVALSLDATWGADQTGRILDILDKHGVKTTFFLAGNWVKKYPDVVRLIAARGHEIGNHSLTHPHMNSLSEQQIEQELLGVENLIREACGQRTTVFRPPFGEYNNKVVMTARKCGYEVVQWSIDSLDWKDLTADQMISRVMSRLHNGAIVLFHNAGKHTPEALDRLIPMLKEKGFRVVKVSDLLLKGDYYVDPSTGEQRPLRSDPAQGESPLGREAVQG